MEKTENSFETITSKMLFIEDVLAEFRKECKGLGGMENAPKTIKDEYDQLCAEWDELKAERDQLKPVQL